jgi:predicted peptidase
MSAPELQLIESETLPYLLSVPVGIPPVHGWPVLCFLHGYDEGAPTPIDEALTVHGPLNPKNPVYIRETFMVLAPQMPARGDRWYRFAEAVHKLVADARRAHGGDPQRTYLTGFSFGGNGVFDLAISHTDFWAALWPVDLTRIPQADPRRPVWLSVGEVTRRATPAFINALGLKPAEASLTEDRLYLDQGQNHVGAARMAYRDERIYEWLLARHL